MIFFKTSGQDEPVIDSFVLNVLGNIVKRIGQNNILGTALYLQTDRLTGDIIFLGRQQLYAVPARSTAQVAILV